MLNNLEYTGRPKVPSYAISLKNKFAEENILKDPSFLCHHTNSAPLATPKFTIWS